MKLFIRNKKSVFINIIIHFITIFMIIIVIGNGLYYFNTKKYLVEEMILNNEQILSQNIKTYEVFLESTIQTSMIYMEKENYFESFSSAADSYAYDNEIYERLNTLTRLNEFIYSIYYFDTNPESIYVSTGLRFDSYDFYDREFINTLNYEKNYYVLPARDLPTLNAGTKHVIPIVINLPLNSTNYTCTYIINMDANGMFNHLIKNADLDERNTFKIVDYKNMILASSSEENDIFGNFESFEPELNFDLAGNSQIAELNGKKQLISYSTSEKYEWRYITYIDYDMVFSNIEKPLKINIFIALISLIISFVLVFFVSREVYSPLKEIINLIGIDIEETKNHNEYILIRQQLSKYLNENKQFKETIDSNKSLLKKQFIYNLIALNNLSYEDIEQKMRAYDIDLLKKSVVLLFEIDDMEVYTKTFDSNGKILWGIAFENIITGLADEQGKGVFANIETGKFALAFSMDSDTPNPAMENTTRMLIYEIKEKVNQILKYSVTVGVGHIKESYEYLHESFKEASKALQFKESIGNDEIIFYKELMVADKSDLDYPQDIENRVTQSVLTGDISGAEDNIKNMFAVFSKRKIVYPVNLHIFAVRLLNTIIKLIMELGIDEADIKPGGKRFSSLMSELMSTKSEAECIEIFTAIVNQIGEIVNDKRNSIIHEHVQLMLNYINEHYADIISLDIIADYTNLNRCYVGRIFKQYMSMGIVDYVNQVRIERAAEMLQNPDLKISEIAYKVGFNNTNYFNKIFKKVKKMTPGKYKEKYS